VKLTDPPYVLQQFDDFFGYEVHDAMTGNGSYVNLLKFCFEKFVKSLQQAELFLVGAILKLCAALLTIIILKPV